MFQITTVPRSTDWVVLADWLGAVRVVHRGDLFSCLRFRKDHS